MQKERKSKILIVDDEARNVKLLEALLSSKGYDIVLAYNGKECFQQLELNADVDLVLLDIMMPVMDGYEVCKILKSNELFKHIPIILLTALDDDESQIRGLESGAVDYITKPFKKKILESRVHNHITLKRANDVIKELYEDLKDTEKARDALSHMIVHDLRNPLMAIQGVVGLLQMASSSLPENIVQSHLQIQGAAEEMSTLISAILDISKMESETMNIASTLFSASDLAKEVADDSKVIYDVAGVNLELQIKEEKIKVMADKEILRRILKNLLSNSLKFTPEGSTVELHLEKIDKNAVYRVNDEGPGIPSEFRDKIFNKFYQISSRDVKKQSGVGLGLAFCRMAAEAMKGEIWVEDRADSKSGSSFCIKLPIAYE